MAGTIHGLTPNGLGQPVLPPSAKTDLSTDIGNTASAVRQALDAAGLGSGAGDAEVAAFVEDDTTATGAAVRAQVQAILDSMGLQAQPVNAWVHWGDSMTAASSSGGWVAKLAAVTGLSHHNGGVGGETAAQIATRMLGTPGDPYRDRKFTIGAGRNGFKTTPLADIVATIRGMLNHFTVAHKGFVFDIAPWAEETMPAAAGSNREKLNTLNGMLETEFPTLYLPVFASLRTDEAAQAASIEWTAQDLIDISNGVTPVSFRTDGGHLNQAGGRAVAYFVQKAAFQRGYITQQATLPEPPVESMVTNLALAPDPGLYPSAWTGNGGLAAPYENAQGIYSIQTVTGMTLDTAVRQTGKATTTAVAEVSVGREATNRAPVTAGTVYTVALEVRASKAMAVQIRTRGYAGTSSPVVDQTLGDVVNLVAGVPQTIRCQFTPAATVDRLTVSVLGTTAGSLSDGSYLEATAFMLTEGASAYPYRDGNSEGWAWSGTAGQSTSTGMAAPA